MKYIMILFLLTAVLTSCKKFIELDPVSNAGTEAYYRNYTEVNSALTGCYNGLQDPLEFEWRLTELRTDNAKQGVPNSQSVINLEFNQFDQYVVAPSNVHIYSYWLAVYRNIRSINYVLRSLGARYENGAISFGSATAQLTQDQLNTLAGEALFLRAYHNFNLVRLFGDIFLLTEPVLPSEAKNIGRTPVAECYSQIIADLTAAGNLLPSLPYAQIPSGDLGRATSWAAKGLLAKVYLTMGNKTAAAPLLDDIISNSGYGLESTYERVFSISNEMNREILFAVRFKAGGLGLGNMMANHFAPNASGNAVVNGNGRGYNYPTDHLNASYKAGDTRKGVNIGIYGTASVPYVKKFISPVLITDDAENDFPVLRYSDILLMKAEAEGNGTSSLDLINQVRTRAGATDYVSGDFESGFYRYRASDLEGDDAFNEALRNERRLELAFENQRFFDIARSTDKVQVIRNYFASEFDAHYSRVTNPILTLAGLQSNVTEGRFLLPIPQRELDTNGSIEQNEAYR